jgi:uncharacterized membrane protein SpoIIM required for sporulation/ABC-type transport system involved in multi-copper enzyme maturation permease subunit
MAVDLERRVIPQSERSSLRMAWIIARRELRDTLRDWRIVTPIVILTLIFPWLMNWTAQVAIDFVQQRDAPLIGERLIPFLLMIVGFFPISFSLVIALETFVGEKERRSIEPLLSMPITNLELYLGKMVSATAPPLIGSILGIAVYLVGLYGSIGYVPSPGLLIQIFALTVTEALVMVSGAVVVSSQTTSVRAANLLASFIIIPMALLLQAESVVMFWGNQNALWTVVLALLVVMLILIRMGVRTFNREEILGREIDELNLRRTGRLLRYFFVESPDSRQLLPGSGAASISPVRFLRWVGRVYRHDLPFLLRQHRAPLAVVVLTLFAAALLGIAFVTYYPLPQEVFQLEDLAGQDFKAMADISFLPSLTTSGIFVHNVEVLLLAGLLAVVSLGVLPILLLMVPIGLSGFLAGQMASVGYDPLLFVTVFVLPHGLFEIPAAIVATAFALRLGASLTAPREGLTVGEAMISAMTDFVKVFVFLVLPLLLIAAFVEANVTPQLVMWVYGG